MRTTLRAILVFLSLLLSGCVSFYALDQEVEKTSRWHFGITRIEQSAPDQFLSNIDVSNLGFWFGSNDVGVGYKHDELMSFSRECKLVFIIRNRQQLAGAIQLVSQQLGSPKEGVCVLEK